MGRSNVANGSIVAAPSVGSMPGRAVGDGSGVALGAAGLVVVLGGGGVWVTLALVASPEVAGEGAPGVAVADGI
jgi:hypothetical protein